MNILGRTGGLVVKDTPSKQRTVSGLTFDGLPFSVQLASDTAFDHGASAGIYQGYSSSGPWTESLLVAVKVIGQMLKPAQQEVLLRELRTASQAALRHPRILEFLGTVEVGDQKSLVSLYMRNGNLIEYLKSHPGCDKLKLIVQVAEGVDYLHTHARVVHGDLKCENVLVSDSGDALLADFGLSTFVEKSQFDGTTTTGIRDLNTIRFAAPELLLGSEDPTVRPRSKTVESDVYAFGMLMLQAVTELPPWSDQNALAVIQKVCQGQHPPRPTSDIFATIRPLWWNVCGNCWSPKPGDRPRMNTVLSLLSLTDGEPYDRPPTDTVGLTYREPSRRLEGHEYTVWSVAYFPAGRSRVVSGSRDGSIRVWDTLTGRTVVGPMIGHEGPVLCVSISPDGRQICSCSADYTIRRWDAEFGAPIGKPMIGHDADVNSVAFSPDGTLIVSGSDTVRLWAATTGEALGDPLVGHGHPLAIHGHRVRSVAFSPDGRHIASGANDGTICLWDSATRARLCGLYRPRKFIDHDIWSVCFSPDRIHLVSGYGDGTIRIWNTSTRQPVRDIKAHGDVVRSVAVSPSGRYIASGAFHNSIRIWDAQTGDAVGVPLVLKTGWIHSVAFSPDGRGLVSSSNDGTVHIWDLFA